MQMQIYLNSFLIIENNYIIEYQSSSSYSSGS